MRSSEIIRKTNETDIKLYLSLKKGESLLDTGCGFLNHMLTLFARHGDFSLSVVCNGDIEVDYHHTVEDIAICLGDAFKEALGDMKGITRYGSFILPMDESLILTAVDISGRSGLYYELNIPTEKVGDFDTELVREFFEAFVRHAGVTLHIKQLSGANSHHIIEGTFKSFARAMKQAVSIDENNKDIIPSTKGVL